LLLTLGCGGKIQDVPDGGNPGASSSSGPSSGASSGSGASNAAGGSSGASSNPPPACPLHMRNGSACPVAGWVCDYLPACGGSLDCVCQGGAWSCSQTCVSVPDDAGEDAAGEPLDAETDGGDSGMAEVPDAFPPSCNEFSFELEPDAAANTCAFTPADVACSTSADCVTQVMAGCGCFQPVYGVNKMSTAVCIPPPCPALPTQTCLNDASAGYLTQDCQFVDSVQYAGFPESPNETFAAVACVNHQCETYAAGPN
jgi:hypothetical protein